MCLKYTSRFSPKRRPKILCNRRHNSAPKCVGFQMDRTFLWGSYCIMARFAVSCTLLLKHLVLATQDTGRTWTLDCSDNALPMNSFAGDLREDYFKL